MLSHIPVAMGTQHFQNGCIFVVFLQYFKFPSVKVSKNFILDLEYEMEQKKETFMISFMIYSIFCSEKTVQ